MIPWWGRSPGEGDATTSVFLPGESYTRRSLGATVHGVTKSQYDLATKQQQQQGCDLDHASAQQNARSVFLGKAAHRQPSPMESNWSFLVLISANLLQLGESFNLNCSSS